MPVFGLTPASYGKFTEFKTRDIVLLASEATADLCQEAPHWSFVVDVTVEIRRPRRRERKSSKTVAGPMILSDDVGGSARGREISARELLRRERASVRTRARRTSVIPFTAG